MLLCLTFNIVFVMIDVFVVTIELKSRPHEIKHYIDSISNDCANDSDK